MAPSKYRRLTGRKRTILGFSQLWMAPDHILLVKSTRFAEQYQHFALADIQAIIVSALPDRTPFQFAKAAACVLWALIFLAVDSRFAQGFFVITGAIGLAFVIADIARGPRCRCSLHTAISRELLAPVSRLRTARAFLDRVRPAIEAIQGSLPADLQIETSSATAIDQPPQILRPPGYLPEILFALFLLNGALILIGHRLQNPEIGGVLLTTLSAEGVILLAALIRRGRRDPRRMIYVLMAVAIVCMGWDAFGVGRGIVTWIGTLIEAGQRGFAVPPTLPLETIFPAKGLFFAAGWRFAAGSLGLALARFERK